MTSNPSKLAIEQYVAALQADRYKVQFKNSQTGKGYWLEYTQEQLLRSTGYLRMKNAAGFDVYARPVGWQYVLLDDLTRETLGRIKADDLRPCLLIETSPANYQAWLILDTLPTEREQAKAICQALALIYNADLCSAEPDHVGRLPGLTNRKTKHQQANGQYPFVRLHRAIHRLSSFSTPVGARVVNEPAQSSLEGALDTDSTDFGSELSVQKALWPVSSAMPISVQHLDRQGWTGRGSHSEHDFGIVVGLVKKGWSDERIAAHLLAHSPDLLARKGNYVDTYMARTIREARRRGG